MAIWRNDKTGAEFDDGLAFKPGDAGFSRDEAKANFGSAAFSYVGTPDWDHRVAGEQAKDAIAAIIDPKGSAKAKAIQAIDAEHDSLAAFATPAELVVLESVKAEKIAALEPADAKPV